VKAETRATRRGATILLVVGIIIACAIASYLGYFLHFLQKNYQAKDIIDVVYDKVETSATGLVPKIKPYVLDHAPGLMDQAKDQMVKYAPDLRQHLEGYAGNFADSLLAQGHDALSQEVREVMQSHSQQIREALEAAGDVQKTPFAERHLQEALEAEFEQAAVNHVDAYLPELLRVLTQTDAKLELYLKSVPEKLTQEEQLEREFVLLLNTLFERGFGRLRELYPAHLGEEATEVTPRPQ
jgi:hypothetical protein